jgi:hypothetical protein
MKKFIIIFVSFLFATFLSLAVMSSDLPIVAVSQFESTVGNDRYYQTKSNPDNYEAMLETQLIKVGRFTVYERNKLDQVLREQGLQKNLANNGTQIQVEGIDYLIYGSVTKMSTEKKQMRTGQFSSVSILSTFGVDIKIVDATTGEIRRAEAIEASIESGKSVATGNFRSSESFANGLVEAQRLVAKKSAALFAESIFPIRVADVDGQDIYLNYGDSILTAGDKLTVVREGRDIVDRDTGKILGSREKVLGALEVVTANANFSIAKKVDGVFEVTNGDRVKISLTASNANDQKQRERKGRRI